MMLENLPIRMLSIGDTPALHFLTHHLGLLYEENGKQFTLDCISQYIMRQATWVNASSGESHVYNVPNVFRSLEQFQDSYTQNIQVYDVVFLAGSSYPLLKRTLKMLQRYTSEDTLILFDGFIGFSFEPMVYSLLPTCTCLTFFLDVIVKYVVPGYFVHQHLDDAQSPQILNLGYTAVASNQYKVPYKELKKRSYDYLLKKGTHLNNFLELYLKVPGLDKRCQSNKVKKFSRGNEVITLESLIYKNIILMIMGDIFSIVNGQSDFNVILNSNTLKPVLESIITELISLISIVNIRDITCGLNPKVSSVQFIKDCLLERKNDEMKMTNPFKGEVYDYTDCHHISFGYFQRTETYGPIILFHLLVLCDYADLPTRSLSFLYSMFIRLAQGDSSFWQSRVTKAPATQPVYTRTATQEMNTSVNEAHGSNSAIRQGTLLHACNTDLDSQMGAVDLQNRPTSGHSAKQDEFFDAQELAIAAADVLAYMGESDSRENSSLPKEDSPAVDGLNLSASHNLVSLEDDMSKVEEYEDEERVNYVILGDGGPLQRRQSATTFADADAIANDEDFILDSKRLPPKKAPMTIQKLLRKQTGPLFVYGFTDKGPEVRNRLFEESRKRLSKGPKNPRISGDDLYKQIERREATLTKFLDDSWGITTDRYGTALMFPPECRKPRHDEGENQ